MSTSGSSKNQLPKLLEAVAEEARAAEGMEAAMRSRNEVVRQVILKVRIDKEYKAQRHRKAGSYTLAEKYGLLDVFPPTVVLVDTKIV